MIFRGFKSFLLTFFLASLLISCAEVKDKRPNIIVILADDLGYSDIGCYGGEIKTPGLDKLAENGIRFSHFYNASRCCPTRASLLTGVYQHQAGIGRMTFNENLPGYRGQLSENTVTIAQLLKQNGYQTGMVGKWHVAETPLKTDQREWLSHQVFYPEFADKNQYPRAKGFDDFYGIIYGVADYFDPFSLVYNDEPVNEVPEDYYITNALSDSAIAFVDRCSRKDNPFFLYLAYTAPHWPLHALPEDIDKYKETYKAGWEEIRNKRYERLRELEIFGDSDQFLSARQFTDSWDANESKEWDAWAMAVHAAMIDRMDQGISRLIANLKSKKEFDNTLILFLSDNGASSERCQFYSEGENDRPDKTRNGQPIIYTREKEVLPGPETTFASIGPKWANVSNTPFRYWKAREYEGGACTPLIAHWPDGITKKGSINNEIGHVMDIMATCIDLAEVEYPKEFDGVQVIPMEGKSLEPIFKTGTRKGHDYIGFEHFNEKAFVSNNGWKIVQKAEPDSRWELYNLRIDRTEMNNVADEYPDKVQEMAEAYEKWAEHARVIPAP